MYGVPQGWVLGPFLFFPKQYTLPLFAHTIARRCLILNINDGQTLAHAFTMSRIDYLHYYSRLVQSFNTTLQNRQDSAEHPHPPILSQIHWLLVRSPIKLKILLLTVKALHKLALLYLSDLWTPYSPSHSLRSSSNNLLAVPCFEHERCLQQIKRRVLFRHKKKKKKIPLICSNPNAK